MKPSPDKAKVPRWVVKMAWCVAICLPLYVLSIGPAVLLNDRYRIPSDRILDWLYAPIMLICEHSPAAAKVYMWYLGDVWHALNFLDHK